MRAWLRCVAFLLAVASGGPVALAERMPEAGLAEGVPPEGPTEAGLEAEFRRSRDALRASPEFKGNDAESHYRLGEVLGHRGDLTGAVEEYRAAIRLKPEFAEAYRGLGVVLMDRHDWAGAAEALQTTVRLQGGDAETFYWLGRSLMGQQDWTGATAALRMATQLKPDDAEAYADLGLVRMVQGDPTGAAEALRLAVELEAGQCRHPPSAGNCRDLPTRPRASRTGCAADLRHPVRARIDSKI
jgi:cytochrome c-type biogenesis protein CcmH/NrfG